MFRNYNNNMDVENLYKSMYIEQTYQKKIQLENTLKYSKPLSIKDAIYYLNKIIDSSDPDTEHEQIYHGYQTAENIRQNYFTNDNFRYINNIYITELFSTEEWNNLPQKYQKLYNTTISDYYNHINDWSWLPVIGLIHDLGKVLVLPEFGCLPEHFSVGDIYPLGCKFQESNVYYEKKYFELCVDFKNNDLNTLNGIYNDNCGFNNINMTFSHDYYLYNILLRSTHILPDEALYIIRFHSFYAWHTPRNNIRSYTNLANDLDWINLPLLKLFQKTDLYSKHNELPDIKNIEAFYENLINKYIQNYLLF
jgi:inositol oxygenase